MHVVDPLGRTLHLAGTPRRIVSLVPSLTEYLFVIGAGERLVGVTEFCIEPTADVAALPKVRGTKNPDREAILALRPDLVLAAKEENRARDVEVLTGSGVPVYVTDILSVAQAVRQLGGLAQVLDSERGAAPLLDELQAALEHARRVQANQRQLRALAFVWRDPWMAVGADTYAHDLLELCGAVNVGSSLPGRYPRAALDAFMRLEPQVILLPDEPYRFDQADLASFAPYPAAAVQVGRVHLCDGKLLTWYGPRTVEALRVFGAMFR